MTTYRSDFSSEPRIDDDVLTIVTGEDLLVNLRFPEDQEGCWAARSHAFGYISGIVDAHQVIAKVENIPCVFEFPQLGPTELSNLVADALEGEPDFLDANAAGLVLRILQKHFPTSKDGRPG
jgi:hypothetical protein